MDSKQAPPAYSDAMNAPPAGTHNVGYVPPAGDQGYPPQAGYAAPPAGYPQPAPGTGYQQHPGYAASGYNYQQTVVLNQPVSQGMAVGTVPDNMGLAIFVTLCCCWPLGLVAIMRAQESRRALERGDISSASTYSAEARRYSMWAIAGGFVSIGVAIIIIVVIVTSNSYTYGYGK